MPDTHNTPVHPMFCYRSDKKLRNSSHTGNILSQKLSETLGTKVSAAVYEHGTGARRSQQGIPADLFSILWRDTVCHNSMCCTEKIDLFGQTDSIGCARRQNACKTEVLLTNVECLGF